MPDLSAFPITKRWPAQHPDRLQLYSLPTPNGVKVSIMLEEIGLPYEVHLVDFNKDDQKTPEFLSLNPNGKIPAIIDPDGPGGKPLGLFESGAILQYLAEKTGKLLPADAARRYQTIQWVYFQMGGIGPMFGQLGYFHKFAGKEIADKRPLERYVAESKRLLGVIEGRLGGRQWIMDDDYTIADISMLGWVRNLIGFYGARELVGFDDFGNVSAWLDRGLARPAVKRGLEIPKRPGWNRRRLCVTTVDKSKDDETDHHLRHQELRHHEEGARLARRPWRGLRLSRLQDRRHRQGQAQAVERRSRLGDAAQPRRHHVSQIARWRQGGAEREQGAGPDAGAALDDQAAGARSRRQIAGRLQAGNLRQGSDGFRRIAARRRPNRLDQAASS